MRVGGRVLRNLLRISSNTREKHIRLHASAPGRVKWTHGAGCKHKTLVFRRRVSARRHRVRLLILEDEVLSRL